MKPDFGAQPELASSKSFELHESAKRVHEPHLFDRLARASSSRGLQTTYARHCVREIATLSRLRENRNSRLRGPAARWTRAPAQPDEVHLGTFGPRWLTVRSAATASSTAQR